MRRPGPRPRQKAAAVTEAAAPAAGQHHRLQLRHQRLRQVQPVAAGLAAAAGENFF